MSFKTPMGLGAIAEGEEGEEDVQPVPSPPPIPAIGGMQPPPPPPPLSMKNNLIPPPPPVPKSTPSKGAEISPTSLRRSPSPGIEGVKVSKIRRATQMFMDDPTMKQLFKPAMDDDVEDASVGAHVIRRKLKGKREEDDMQMLRGIFAAFDENKRGRLSKRELSDALISLGFSPTEELMGKFHTENVKQTGKKTWNISLAAFVSAALKHLDSADDCTEDVMYLFKQFDKKLSGDVSAKMVRHLLHETMIPTRLNQQETEEFLHECMGDPNDLSQVLKYEDLLDKLLFSTSAGMIASEVVDAFKPRKNV
jgi:Ca2+-binding EF-hand superfamily protein